MDRDADASSRFVEVALRSTLDTKKDWGLPRLALLLGRLRPKKKQDNAVASLFKSPSRKNLQNAQRSISRSLSRTSSKYLDGESDGKPRFQASADDGESEEEDDLAELSNRENDSN